MLQVYTSYFSKAINNYNHDMQYVIISNSAPKWWPKELPVVQLKDFAPDWTYVQRYKNDDMDWQAFADQYKNTLISRFDTLKNAQAELLKRLNTTSNTSIVFLCWEKDYTRCHRTLLAQYLFELVYNGEL